MNKEYLKEQLNVAKENYIWTLYFFTTRKKRGSGFLYEAQKVRFKKNDFINSFSSQVIDVVLSQQIEAIDNIQEYNGFNTKVSCDRISIENELISDSFKSFIDCLPRAGDAKLKARYKGYVLEGQPSLNQKGTSVMFFKLANPIVPLNTKRSVMFKRCEDDTLDGIEEEYYRLYLATDGILMGRYLYNFNHSFEKLFNIEQTLHKVKVNAIQKIIDADFISNSDDFANYAKSNNSRTFISLDDERIKRVMDPEYRKFISQTYGIPLTNNGLFNLTSHQESTALVKYLCYKAFQDAETNDVLEADNVTKMKLPLKTDKKLQ
ncbi:MAG: DUF4868 domain-containing protein [Treponema sp.]|nr:DUF4868 domain-containing protein [Treponema sp.]